MKRNKRSRLRGRRTCGWGSRKKHRGKGSRGGRGMAGTGKKAGQKLTFIHRYYERYFGKSGFNSLKKEKLKVINLRDISKNMEKFLAGGIAKKTADGIEINLKGYKILSEGNVAEKVIISASSASEKSKEKIEKAGGKINLE
jgi:large subunit ribosomal protein L15